MTREDKELLLKDLCARLPYGVKIKLIRWDRDEGMYINTTLEPDDIERLLNVKEGDTEIKPYLFPLSSMTKEMMEEFDSLFNGTFQYFNQGVISASYLWDRNEAKFVGEHECSKLIDFFNSHHIDYRNLIEKGLAIDATGLNIY